VVNPDVALGTQVPNGDGYHLERAHRITPAAVDWAWKDRIPLGALTMTVGQPGEGKTTLASQLVARATRGNLAGDLGGPVDGIYLSAEDSPAHTLVPRLIAAGADLERVSFLTLRRDGIDEGLTLPDDLNALRCAVAETQARILIIDPLMAHVSGAVDSHRDHDIRRVLAPLARFADELGIAVVIVAHLNKSEAGDVFRRVGGSIGLTAAVRSILVLAADPDAAEDATARVLIHAKSNLAPAQPALSLGVVGVEITANGVPMSTAGIAWRGESTVTAADVFGRHAQERAAPARDAAKAMLEEVLDQDNPVPVADLKLEAAARNLSWRSVERAKDALPIVAEQVREGRRVIGWTWRFSTPPTPLHRPGGGLENDDATFSAQGLPGADDAEFLYTATSPRGRGGLETPTLDDPDRGLRIAQARAEHVRRRREEAS
jgi:hypothetical protein